MADTQSVGFAEQLKQSNAANITIYVGKRKPDSDPYIVSKIVLTNAAPYFRKIVDCDFKEGRQGVLHFPEDEPEGWTLFLYWLFNRAIPEPTRPSRDQTRPLSPRTLAPFFSALIKASVLGDKYDIPAFQNAITYRVIKTFEISFPAAETVAEVFELTPPSCSLRKLVVEELVVAILRLGVLTFKDIEQFSKLDGFFPLFAECHHRFCAGGKYPRHEYGRNTAELERYFVEEDREIESEVAAMLHEHGQM